MLALLIIGGLWFIAGAAVISSTTKTQTTFEHYIREGWWEE